MTGPQLRGRYFREHLGEAVHDLQRLLRYGIVGLISNALFYTCYLILTWVGVAPLLAATGLYVVGILATYVVNRSWSFASDRAHRAALPRYVFVYALGYAVYMGVLWLLHYELGWAHQIAVLCGIVIVFLLNGTLLNVIFRAHEGELKVRVKHAVPGEGS